MAEIYKASQNAIIETLRDTIKTSLSAIDWSSVTPDIDYEYEHHTIADIQFNAVSVEVGDIEKEHVGQFAGATTGPVINYMCEVSLRIHVAVGGRYNDYDTVRRLTNSINNYLHENNKLGTHLGNSIIVSEPGSIEFNKTFEESDTVGGELIFTALWTGQHTQV